MKPTDRSSVIRSPVYKKQKASTSCDSVNESEDFDAMVKRIKAMRKAELATVLESRGLCAIGKKDDLVNRLVDDYLTQQAEHNKTNTSNHPATESFTANAIPDENNPVPVVMNRKESMIMTNIEHEGDSMRFENMSPNVKQQGILEKKPVSVLKQMFESNVYKPSFKESAMEVAKENSPTQHESHVKEPKSPIRTFKAAMNTALSVLSIEKHRVISSSPKNPKTQESSSRPLSPKMQQASPRREPQQDAIGSSSKLPAGYLSASKVGSISALSAIKAAKTSYLQAGPARMAFNADKQKEMREQVRVQEISEYSSSLKYFANTVFLHECPE